jgi:dipeptidase E
MKLLLTSFWTSPDQDKELIKLVGKELKDIKVAYIENACDIYNDEAPLIEGRKVLKDKGFDFEVVDFRKYKDRREELREKLESKDVYWFTGGNGFYLRSLMKDTGADEIIIDQVKKGKLYVGASGGAVIAGPTMKHFDNQDDPKEAREIIWEGLGLTDIVPVPHVDNPDFGKGCREAGELCAKDGYKTVEYTDTQALLIEGDQHRII